MSAFILSEEHFSFIATAALDIAPFSWFHDIETHELQKGDYKGVLRIVNKLIRWNTKSVRARYGSKDLPGDWERPMVINRFVRSPLPCTLAQVIKALDCLEYQSCEFIDWDQGEEMVFLSALKKACLRKAEGYNEAIWAISSEDLVGLDPAPVSILGMLKGEE